MPIAVEGPSEPGAASGPLNAELIAPLPPAGIDALMPEGRAAQPEQSFAKLPGGFSIGDWFKPPAWRDTVGGARESGSELVRRQSLKELAAGGAQAAERTSGIDLDGDGFDEALRQGQNGSEAAVLQMVRAKADPVYAWALYNDPADTMTLAALEDAISPSTRTAYQRHAVTDSYAGRSAAADRIALEVERGADVPIAVTSNAGGSRVMLITDVRGFGNSQQFLVTHPRSGQTEWVSRKAITDGNIGGSGARLSGYWY